MANTTNTNFRSIIFYSDETDPLGHAVRIVLAEKDISNLEKNYIGDGGDIPQLVKDHNPYHTILTLFDRDLALYDAQIIMEYLDERFPYPPLMPVEPIHRAENRQLRYRIQRDLYALVEKFTHSQSKAALKAKAELRDYLTSIVPLFSNQPYFMSEEYSLVDCYLAPLLWRLEHYDIKLPESAKPLKQYAEKIFARETFQDSLSPAEREYNIN